MEDCSKSTYVQKSVEKQNTAYSGGFNSKRKPLVQSEIVRGDLELAGNRPNNLRIRDGLLL